MAKLQIPIAKGGKGCFIEVDPEEFFSDLSAEVQMEMLGAALEKYLNAGMSSSEKFPAPTKLLGEDLEKASIAAKAKAEANLEDLKAGKIKVKYDAAKAKVKPANAEERKVMSKALNDAKAVLKNRARAQGIKPLSAVPASKWTELATLEVKNNPKYLADARVALAAQESITSELDLTALIVLDPVKVAAAKAKSAKAKTDVDQLSAKQSGLPKSQGKGKVPPSRPNPQHEARH